MRMLGDDVYIQRGETWSLDFSVRNEKGDPYQLLNQWKNPYFVITVTAARYEQEGDFRHTWWLDLENTLVQGKDGVPILTPMKKFIATEALYTGVTGTQEKPVVFDENVLTKIKEIYEGSQMTFVTSKNPVAGDYDVTNYLFFIDPKGDGNLSYAFVKAYELNSDESVKSVEWVPYDMRIIKQFDTKSWIEQTYLYDMKILAGESVLEFIDKTLTKQGLTEEEIAALKTTQEKIDKIDDIDTRVEVQELYDDNIPLMPNYDTKTLILQPTKIYVSANIQGGVK